MSAADMDAGHIPEDHIQQVARTDPQHADTLRLLQQYSGVAYEAKLAVFDVNDGLTAGKIRPPKGRS
jgi:hypothetical protein